MVEFIWVTVLGLGIGTVLRYTLPGRGAYGIVLLPAVGGIVAAGVWATVTWAGWTPDSPWPWVLALGAAAIASTGAAVFASRRRAKGDARLLHQLSGGRA
ncbi:MAG: hypothetical protein HY996_03650 [Micrococcales bacterium]|nr:hypothetical protein [Micrococcales bacterium]